MVVNDGKKERGKKSNRGGAKSKRNRERGGRRRGTRDKGGEANKEPLSEMGQRMEECACGGEEERRGGGRQTR